jgi:LPS-assembly protein
LNVLAVLALAGLLAGPASPSPDALPGGTGPVSVQAERVTREADGRIRLEGGAVVRRGVVTLRARSARVDPESGEVDAVGDVLLTDATRAVAADGLHAILGGPFEAEHVIAFVKDRPVELGQAATAEAARRTGANRLTLTGARLAGDESRRLTLSEARLTLCDCGGAAPSWEIHTRKADVIPGVRAILSWPVLYVTPRFLLVNRPVPVLIVPWLYLPLGDRQSGLLIPEIGSTSGTGLVISQPVFVTLGRSADATVTPEYLFGHKTKAPTAASVRGFGTRLELRWAPAVDAAGTLELAWVHDLAREPGGGSGDRLGISGVHQQGLGPDTRLRLDLGLTSDPVWSRDFTPAVLLRDAFYRRSDLLVSHRSDALVLEGGAAYYQPLAPTAWNHAIPSAVPGALAPSGYGAFGSDVPVFHRWPGLAGSLLPSTLGPVEVSGRVGVQRFAPASGDATSIALGPGDPGGRLDAHQRPVVYALPREAATRLDTRLELRAPFRVGPLALEPYLRGAALGYQFDTARDPAAEAWGVGGALVETELSRRYGDLVHRITPRLEFRAGTGAAGPDGRALALPAYDEWDRVLDRGPIPDLAGTGLLRPARSLTAASESRFQQLRASVESHLTAKGVDRLRLLVGQDVDVGGGRLAETFFSAGAAAGPLGVDLSGRFLAFQGRVEPAPRPSHASLLDPFTELRAGISLGDPHGHVLRAGLLAVGAGGSGTLVAGVDPLFDLRPTAIDAVAQGSVGGRVVLGGGTLGYDALFPGRPIDVPQCSGNGTRRLEVWQVQQHTGSFAWNSPCRCFLAAFSLSVDDCGKISSFKASINLARLGEGAKFP